MAVVAKTRTAQSASAAHGVRVLRAASLNKQPWLIHGFSTRLGGLTACYGEPSLNLGFTKEDAPEKVEENRRLILLALGAGDQKLPWPLLANRQIHSDIIHTVRRPGALAEPGDGLVTNVPGIAIAVLTADCLPVLLADKKNIAVGAIHAGWRGTAKRIVEKGVGVMRHEFGSQPKDIIATLGPSIRRCCYVVGEELQGEFESQFSYASELFHQVQESDPVRDKYPLLFLNARAPGHGDPCLKLHFDLAEANRRQLLDAGVPARQITVLQHCTACETKDFFSHRAQKGNTGRMMAVIGILPRREAENPASGGLTPKTRRVALRRQLQPRHRG